MDRWIARLQEAVRYSNTLESGLNKISSHEGIREKVENVVQSICADIEAEQRILDAGAVSEIEGALSIAVRREIHNYPLDEAGILVDAVLALLESSSMEIMKPELPLLLFEDLAHVQTVAKLGQIWKLIESRSGVLTSSLIMERAIYPKMVMMRLGNYVLNRLSATHDTVLCGRVQLFLAAAMPIADRSGVNLIGDYNYQNVTEFESESDFENASTINGSTNIPGSSEDIHDQKFGEPAINYSLYFKFWQLQRFFSSKPEKAPSGCASSVRSWNLFSETADVVLSSFESKPLMNSEPSHSMFIGGDAAEPATTTATTQKKKRKIDHAAGNNKGDVSSGVFFSVKYLTSSRLLKLQLSDPSLLRTVLVQFTFVFNAIEKYLNGTTSSKLDGSVVEKIKADSPLGMASLRERTFALLKAIPPDGKRFVLGLKQILLRENQWYKWKAIDKCKNFVRSASGKTESDIHNTIADDAVDSFKIKGNAKKAKKVQLQRRCKEARTLWRSFDIMNAKENLMSSNESMKPTFSGFIKPMEIAIDPENGIEDEYHPRIDPVYCWRGFRILSRTDLDAMASVVDGSLENVTKLIFSKSENT